MLAKARNGSSSVWSGPKARVFLVDDHPIMREGLASLINKELDLEVCGQAEGVEEALPKLGTTKTDLLITDISLQDGNGIDLIKNLKTRQPDIKIVVSSMHDENLFAERVLRAGAIGYISKTQPPTEILHAIRQALQGKIAVSKEVASRFMQQGKPGNASVPESPMAKLTNRELTIFELIGQGVTTRDIASKLFVSIKTVETHREHIKSKLNLANATDLVQHAVCWHLERGGPTTSAVTNSQPSGEA